MRTLQRGALVWGLLFLCAFPQVVEAQTGRVGTVLVLYDGGREFRGVALIDRSLDSTLNSALAGAVFREFMDVTRIRSANYEEVLRDFYRAKYADNRPDVIVAVRGRPLDFLLRHRATLFPGIPIVSIGMDARQLGARSLPSDVIATSLRIRYWPTVALALTLQPELEHVVVVAGASPNDAALEDLVRDEFRPHGQRLRYTYLSGLPLDTLLERVSDLPPRTAVLFLSFTQDREGRSFLPNDVLARIAQAANAPTYVASEDVVDAGVVGGDVLSFTSVGTQAARLAVRVLGGESLSGLPTDESTERVVTVDATQLARWSIPLSRVPAGAIVLNRLPTLWEAYRWRIIGGATVILIQAVLIAMLIVQRRHRRAVEESLRISEGLRRNAVLEERNRMARDMHDTLAQGFTGVIVQLEAAQLASRHGSPAATDAHIRSASELARLSLGEARRSIRALRPQALEDGNLCLAMDGLMKQMTARTEIQVGFSTRGQPRRLAPADEDNLLRVHQEILSNALKHSGAKRLEATVSFEADAVRLETSDDGTGFDPSKKHDGMGLLGIRERVHQMRGELWVDSRVGGGTRIRVVLPSEGDSNGSAS